MDIKKHITALGFVPKNGTNGIYHKIYVDYAIEIDFEKQSINYGSGITADSKTTQNFSDAENFVVLECVDRLLTKGYKPQNIILEKTWPSGHGTSGRLDICVNRKDGTPYMLIECKTYGREYNKELARIRKDGGQLFTYFQLSGGKADVLMLYASELKGNKFVYVNEIIKIEDDYRNGDVKDIYEKWNKLTKDNGIFDSWVQPYNFQSKALTKEQLKEIKAEDSSFIFNRFLEILRHNVVSDKGNAFNKIFTLFLCKVYDETTTGEGEELKFQWLEGRDNPVDFQLRLTDLYREGMKKFLDRIVSDFNNEDFDKRCANLTPETKQYLLREVNKLRLEKNNEFAIKEVYDNASFEENAKVVKEVVELIQGYRIRYNKRQQYLSDFFELLLTTGLKQESGQYFTPVPIAQFIIKSLPLDSIMAEKLSRKDGEILPYMIDYAAGSGHFITEFMHEIQDIINACDTSKYIEETRKHLINWQNCHFDWATDYVYGIEKDYRLVKVGKVGCYLHGDGLANVILSDGLANFYNNKEYKGKLRKQANDGQKDNQQFDIVLSNPPYSVSSFRQTTRDYYTEKDFELYSSLTDNSSEIECLFIERTKQLLKDGGIAGIVLPSSILSNFGIYTKAREMILQYFDIIAITELGSNTFMATSTNTVILFLRRRDNYFSANTKSAVDTYFRTLNDVTVNGIETPASKYVAHVWEGLDYTDYITLLQKSPNDKVKAHEIYAEYKKKISAKSDAKLYDAILNIEAEKLLYFILAYPQKVVIVKSGEKDVEKHFLGYEFSNRRGNEGIHAIQKGKNIDECTKLFDANSYDNPEKASSYVYRAFKGDYTSPIAEGMQSHIVRTPLIEMLTFDRDTFEKDLSLVAKKKVNYELVWGNDNLEVLGDIASIQKGTSITKGKTIEGNIPVVAGGKDIAYYHNVSNREGNIITISASGAYAGFVNYFTTPIFASDCNTVKSKDESVISTKLIYVLLRTIQPLIYQLQKGQAQPHVYGSDIANIKIPIPSDKVQEKIIKEINELEERIIAADKLISGNKAKIYDLIEIAQKGKTKVYRLSNNEIFSLAIGKRVLNSELKPNGVVPVYSANVITPFGYVNDDIIQDFSVPSILWGIDGDWMVNYISSETHFYPTDHCGVLRVLSDEISAKYLSFIFEKIGKEFGFCRKLRASIDRIAGISIELPDYDVQLKTISQIKVLEDEIHQAQLTIENVDKEIHSILNKYL